ncbi:MAG: hypothetical protein JWM10_5275 [Myxococcaceae bacterium]|nr:hypothetical protein [Myxococcaceae bacterium]
MLGAPGCVSGPAAPYTEPSNYSGLSSQSRRSEGSYSESNLTEEEITSNGSIYLRTTPEQAFRATLEGLRAEGYDIAYARPQSATIVTRPRPLGTRIHGVVSGSVMSGVAVTYTIQLTVQLRPDGPNGMRVTATPSMFQDSTDISAENVWRYEGGDGLYQRWNALFRRIRQLV